MPETLPKNSRKPRTTAPINDAYGHLQPQALDVERAVLGALMVDKDAYAMICEILNPDSFYEHRNQLIYTAIRNLRVEEKPVDMLTVTEQLSRDTVYGPWGRPDMAPFIFMKAILNGKPIHIFNNGNMRRDFTYISDIINGVLDVIKKVLNVKGAYIYEGMKAGDVTCTYADTTKLEKDYGYSPKTSVEDGLDEMYLWFKSNINKFD